MPLVLAEQSRLTAICNTAPMKSEQGATRIRVPVVMRHFGTS